MPSSEELENYREAVLPIVSDSFELSSQNPTDAELLSRVDTWSRILCGVIPENYLPDVFKVAFANHRSPFPINAYDLKAAWEQIEREMLQNRPDFTSQCDECDEYGFVRAEVDGVIRSRKCRHEKLKKTLEAKNG